MMTAHREVITINKDGELLLQHLPFVAGQRVEVIVLSALGASTNAIDQLRGSVLKYDEPFEPVGVDDWEALK